jgi:hypothetical protein
MVSEGAESAYEALQLYKSKVNRFRSKLNYHQSMELCASSAIIFLRNEYETAGNEMSKLFIEILEESNVDLSPEYRNLLNSIDSAFPFDSMSRGVFLKECLKYSVKTGSRLYGDTLLHARLAENLWSTNERPLSIKHFALGEAPESLWRHVSWNFILIPDNFSSYKNLIIFLKVWKRGIATLQLLWYTFSPMKI